MLHKISHRKTTVRCHSKWLLLTFRIILTSKKIITSILRLTQTCTRFMALILPSYRNPTTFRELSCTLREIFISRCRRFILRWCTLRGLLSCHTWPRYSRGCRVKTLSQTGAYLANPIVFRTRILHHRPANPCLWLSLKLKSNLKIFRLAKETRLVLFI